MRSADADLQAVARIRNAAVRRFGTDGFKAGIRTIAADAGVSPALVIHHFGSKAGLRQACDQHALAVIRESKTETITSGGAGTMLEQLAQLDNYGPLFLYVVASLEAGGDLARHLVEQMTADAEEYLARGVAAGTIRPSLDPAARARYLVLQSVGAMLLHLRLTRREDRPTEPAAAMRSLRDVTFLPALEVMTEGLLADRSMLDAYLAHPDGVSADRHPDGVPTDRHPDGVRADRHPDGGPADPSGLTANPNPDGATSDAAPSPTTDGAGQPAGATSATQGEPR